MESRGLLLLLLLFITSKSSFGDELCEERNTYCSRGTILDNSIETDPIDCHKKCRLNQECKFSQYILPDELCVLYEKCLETIINPLENTRTIFTDVNCPIKGEENLIRGRCGSGEFKVKKINDSLISQTNTLRECAVKCLLGKDYECVWFSYNSFTKHCFRYSKCNHWVDELPANYINGHSLSFFGRGYDYYLIYGVNGIINVRLNSKSSLIFDCSKISPQLSHFDTRPWANLEHFNEATFLNHVNYPTICGSLDNEYGFDCAILYPDKADNNMFKWKYYKGVLGPTPQPGSANSYIPGKGWWITRGNYSTLVQFGNMKDDKIPKMEEANMLPFYIQGHCQVHVQKGGKDGLTFIIGGYDGNDMHPIKMVNYFDWKLNQWSRSRDLPDELNDIQCIQIDDNKILATSLRGHYDSYIYDIELDQWSRGPVLNRGPALKPKLNTLFKTFENEIIALMSHKDDDDRDVISFFKFEFDEWTTYGETLTDVGINSDYKFGIHPVEFDECYPYYGKYVRRN